MRNVLFVLEPLGTGKAWRTLAIAEQLKLLFPAIEPRFLAGPAAATLLRGAGSFQVDDTLAPILPPRAAAQGGDSLAALAEREARRLGPTHAREALRVARACQAGLVVVDGLLAAPPVLARGGFEVALLVDHLLDAQAETGLARRAAAALLRRALVASTKLRFFLGEPGWLASPELRVWSRRFFRYTGLISGLSRLSVREQASLRDDLGLGRKKLLVVAAGCGFAAGAFEGAIAAADLLMKERGDVVVELFGGPELSVDDSRARKPSELVAHLAIADAAIVPGGVSLLAECAGLGVPTLALPLPGSAREKRQVDFFAERHGVRRVEDGSLEPAAIAAAARPLLERPEAHRPRGADDADAQRRNSDFVADLLAEALGRRRPTVKSAD
jgi:UDP:flavonoid glycosyltransferase YjiC (YdhE family)